MTSTLLRTISCVRQNALLKTPKRGNWWPDQVFQDYGIVCAISTTSGWWSHLCVFDSFSKLDFSKCTTSRSMSLLEMPMRQHTNTSKKQQYQDVYNYSVAIMLREMQREGNEERPLETRLDIDSYTNNHFSQLCSASDLDLVLHGHSHVETHLDPESWENFGATRVNEYKANENRRGEDSSHPKGIEIFVRETAKKGYPDPQNFDNPMSAPLDYDVRQCGRVLELQNRDLTKITSVPADTCIQFRGPVTPTLVKTLCLSLVLMTIFLTVCYLPFSRSFLTMSSSKPIGARRMSEWYKELTDKDDDPHSPFWSRVSDAVDGTNR